MLVVISEEISAVSSGLVPDRKNSISKMTMNLENLGNPRMLVVISDEISAVSRFILNGTIYFFLHKI